MKKIIFAGLLVFLAVLVTSFPARVAYNWFAPPAINLTGINGSVWSGSASEGLAAGAYFRNLRWQVRPSSIFSGRVQYAVSAQPAGGNINTDIAVALDGSLSLTDLKGSVPLDLVHQSFQQQGIRGDVTMEFASLILQDGLPVSIDGSVTVADFYVPGLSASRLGDYRADFTSGDQGITASVDDLSGMLDVAGIVTLAPDRSYRFVGDVAARPGAPQEIANQLAFLGSPDERGLRSFRFEGSL